MGFERLRSWSKWGATAMAVGSLFGCPEDDGTSDDGASVCAEADDECTPPDGSIAALDESSCMPGPNDYTPTVNGSADDMWPSCANDDGEFHPSEQPGAAARTEAFEMIRQIFAGGLTPEDFTAAREQYSLDGGIESRVLRREDVHYPDIPFDPAAGVDFDKLCTIEANVEAYPDRCAGPAKLAPIINDAFVAGQAGECDPAVHAARIDAAIEWFSYLSVFKEATFSCPRADKGGDCDSSWGYYNGGNGRTRPIGYAADVMAASPLTNDRVFDGISAMRCFRDTYAPDMDVDFDDPFYAYGRDQLDAANNHAAAVVLRARLDEQLRLCGSDADANWAWIQVFGQAIIKPAQDTDGSLAADWVALIENDAPTPEEIEAGAATLDALFPCP